MDQKSYTEILESSPKNWGRWGEHDELGTLNFLTSQEVLGAMASVRQGKVFSLGLPIGRKEGDVVFPGRTSTIHLMVQDEGSYMSGKSEALPGGLKYADDAVFMYLQGTTQCDALGHAWHGDKIYNGYDSKTTIGGLSKASIVPIAQKGIVGRGVLLDLPRYRGTKHLSKGELVTLEDLQKTAAYQNVEIRRHDILLIRTGYITLFYDVGPDDYYRELNEPGITYSKELVE
jgi:hypothetical protein